MPQHTHDAHISLKASVMFCFTSAKIRAIVQPSMAFERAVTVYPFLSPFIPFIPFYPSLFFAKQQKKMEHACKKKRLTLDKTVKRQPLA